MMLAMTLAMGTQSAMSMDAMDSEDKANRKIIRQAAGAAIEQENRGWKNCAASVNFDTPVSYEKIQKWLAEIEQTKKPGYEEFFKERSLKFQPMPLSPDDNTLGIVSIIYKKK